MADPSDMLCPTNEPMANLLVKTIGKSAVDLYFVKQPIDCQIVSLKKKKHGSFECLKIHLKTSNTHLWNPLSINREFCVVRSVAHGQGPHSSGIVNSTWATSLCLSVQAEAPFCDCVCVSHRIFKKRSLNNKKYNVKCGESVQHKYTNLTNICIHKFKVFHMLCSFQIGLACDDPAELHFWGQILYSM